MKMIVGLGNPGSKYARNRHNIGFMFLDYLADNLDASSFQMQSKFDAEISDVPTQDKLIFVKPQTFMNNSGQPVRKMSDFYGIDIQDIIVVHDDLDIALGLYKIQAGKGPKVHNGINSVEDHLGSSDFKRVRIGIDSRAEDNNIPGRDYVLQDFAHDELKTIEETYNSITTELKELWTR